MRSAALVTCVLGMTVLGGTCVPTYDDNTRPPPTGTTLAVAISDPNTDRTVPQGERVAIKWSAANLTGEDGAFSLVAQSRDTGARTTLQDGVTVDANGRSGEFAWDTTDFVGAYALYAVLTAAGRTVEERAGGVITVDAPPTFEFTAPASNATLNVGQSPAQPLTISWRASDADAQVKIGLDTDSDHGGFNSDPNETGRNEFFIATREITSATTTDSISFNGTGTSGTVTAGTYTLFAIVSDSVNPDLTVDAAARITVTVTDPNEATTTKIVQPAADKTFLATDASMTIEVDVNQPRETLVDLKIDTDDNNQNGNEITIDSQRLVAANADPFTFAWNGTDSSAVPVRDGIYRILAFVSSGASTPTITQSSGFVFRRATTDTPLIGLILPAAQVTATPGTIISIKWRDDDPKEDESDAAVSANIKLVLDKDGNPATTADQVVVLTGRKAKGDGVNDTFNWQVPDGALEAGTLYTLIALIDRDTADPFDSYSVAPGKFLAPDPTSP